MNSGPLDPLALKGVHYYRLDVCNCILGDSNTGVDWIGGLSLTIESFIHFRPVATAGAMSTFDPMGFSTLLFGIIFCPISIPFWISVVVAGPPGIIGARNGNTVFTTGATLWNTVFIPSHAFLKKLPIFLKKPTAIVWCKITDFILDKKFESHTSIDMNN